VTDTTISWRELLDEATRRLSVAGSPTPAIDARRLVERASGAEGGELVMILDSPVTQRGAAHFDAMLTRRSRGEPLQYVLGAWGFRQLDLFVDRRVLIPRPETEILVGHALAELDRRRRSDHVPRVVDLGTGSGAIALAIAFEHPAVEVWGTDSSADALDVARANLAGLGRPGRRVRLVEGWWFDALPDDLRGTIDVVVTNPPYIADAETLPPEVDDWEPRAALRAGPLGTEACAAIVGRTTEWLAPGGSLVLELAPHQAAEIAALARAEGFVDVAVHEDLTGRPRVLVARAPRGVR
jgi:release factor glutamine methyltransferase